MKEKLALLAAVAVLTACTTARLSEEKRAPEGQSRAPDGVTSSAPPPLEPQAEGMSLPPRDSRIAERWPPEIKRLVDNMLALYPKGHGERPPSVKEVERKMGITLTERPLQPEEARTWHKRFVITGTHFVDPAAHQYGMGESYDIWRARPPVGMTQNLRLVISPRQSGFCLDPYELAVYTGSSFVNFDTSVHVGIRQWPPAYVWGMFRWSNTGRYGAPGFYIVLGQDRDPVTRKIINDGCVSEITVHGRYQEEQ